MAARGATHVVLYDGDCGFCARWRVRMERRDSQRRVEWLSVHDPSVPARFPAVDREDALRQMYVIGPDGALHKGAEGWRELFRVLDGLAWIAALYAIPGAPALFRRLYRAIAARRQRLSCSTSACRRGPAGDPGSREARPGGGGLAPLLCVAAAPLLLVANGCAGPPPDPLVERLRADAGEQVAAVLLPVAVAYGGFADWSGHRNVEYTQRLEFYGGQAAPQTTARQVHRLGLGEKIQAYVEDLDGPAFQVVRLEGDRVEVSRAGAVLTGPEATGYPRAFATIARWTFTQPWILFEPGADLQPRAERTPPAAGKVPPGLCDVVRLALPPGPGGGRDWHDFYVGRLDHLVDRVHSYRAEDGNFYVTVWSEHRRFGNVRVATRRTTYDSDASGAVGALQLVVEYSGVRFDAPFGDDIFRTPAATAPAATTGASAAAPAGAQPTAR